MSAGGGSSGGAGALNRMALSRDGKAASLILEERIRARHAMWRAMGRGVRF